MHSKSIRFKPLCKLLLLIFLFGIESAEGQTKRKSPNPGPSAKWVGQSGKDYVGKSTTAGSDNIQDIQIHVSGMQTARLSNITLKGKGGGEWQWAPGGKKPPGGWAMHLIPDSRPGHVELFFESDQVETGREFELKWTVKDQPEQTIYFAGGQADPTKPIASAEIAAKWIGQDLDKPVDLTNRSAAVGPDSFEDTVIELSKLSDRDAVNGVDVETSDGLYKWSFGQNLEAVWSAELIRTPEKAPTARLILSVPFIKEGSLEGKSLKISVRYASNAVSNTTLVAGKADGDRAMPLSKLPKMSASKWSTKWLGSVTKSKLGQGAVQFEINQITADFRSSAAILTDNYGTTYGTSSTPDKPAAPNALPMIFERLSLNKARVEFLPIADLENQPLSLRLVGIDGSNTLIPVTAGKTDLSKRVPTLRSEKSNAKPGDDLQALVNRGGTVILNNGDYKLDRPLIIDKPTRIEAAPNAKPILTFRPGGTGDWTSAIKIRSGGTTLSGLIVRFAGPIPWSLDVAYGPAVIATTDNRDSGFNHDAPIWGITLDKVTVYGPPVPRKADPKQPPEAIKLVRILNGHFGRIERCVFKGGTIHLQGGPWAIRQNRHDGPLPGSFAYDAFAITKPLGLALESNRIEPLPGSGKLWRFANLTQYGSHIRVAGNLVKNVGPRDDDSIADMNANEIFLTESYRIKFEGEPAQISEDGSLVILPGTLAEMPRAGDCLAILSGPNAGRYHVVSQSMGDGSIIVEPPIDPKDRSINPPSMSLAQGFRDFQMDRNTIDSTGSKTAFNLVLAGNHFGSAITNNTLIGGGESLRLTSFPTEFPNIWGWSHAPMFSLSVTGNTVQGSDKPARLAVDQSSKIKTSKGRVYYSADISGNSFGSSVSGPALQIGDPGTKDPNSLSVIVAGNKSPNPDSEIRVISGRVNGIPQTDTTIPISTGPALKAGESGPLKR
jgi:hypothetical protein